MGLRKLARLILPIARGAGAVSRDSRLRVAAPEACCGNFSNWSSMVTQALSVNLPLEPFCELRTCEAFEDLLEQMPHRSIFYVVIGVQTHHVCSMRGVRRCPSRASRPCSRHRATVRTTARSSLCGIGCRQSCNGRAYQASPAHANILRMQLFRDMLVCRSPSSSVAAGLPKIRMAGWRSCPSLQLT